MLQVQKIPTAFDSLHQYFGSYVYPLLEETRTELSSSFETISKLPFAQIVNITELKPRCSKRYDVEVDEWRRKMSSNRTKEPYKTLPGDVFVLTDFMPQSVSDLKRVGRFWSLASKIKIPGEDEDEDDVLSYTFFRLQSAKELQLDDDGKISLFVIYLTNVVPNRRIWKALSAPGNVRIISEVLRVDCERSNEECCMQESKWGWKTGLNDSQAKAVSACLGRVHCYHKASVDLIWGPPGTGKTKTVSILLANLLKMKCRTVVCAPTNVAIKELASRVLKLVKESYGGASLWRFGDILLFGSKERLKVGVEVEDVFLGYRVRMLQEFFAKLTGWRNCLTSMVDFLEDCVTHYDIFVENEKQIREKNNGEREIKSFLQYVRDRFKRIAARLRRCLIVFLTHIPETYLTEKNCGIMINLLKLLECFKIALFQEDVSSKKLKKFFSYSFDSFDEQLSHSNTEVEYNLYQRRHECHCLLKCLLNSLTELRLPEAMGKDSLKDFCFQNASLFFCTVTCSSKLHYAKIEPFSFLVIDEAAQLKESESTISLQLPGIRHAVLIGDENQLPAMVKSSVC